MGWCIPAELSKSGAPVQEAQSHFISKEVYNVQVGAGRRTSSLFKWNWWMEGSKDTVIIKAYSNALPRISSYYLNDRMFQIAGFQGNSNFLFGRDNLPPTRMHKEEFPAWVFLKYFSNHTGLKSKSSLRDPSYQSSHPVLLIRDELISNLCLPFNSPTRSLVSPPLLTLT